MFANDGLKIRGWDETGVYGGNLEEGTAELDPSLISGKVVLLPFNDEFISFPLLQSSWTKCVRFVKHTVIKNIIIYDELRRLVCQKFTSRESFFTYPFMDSWRLNISFVSNLEERTVELDPSLTSGKVVLLPFNDAFISFPLLQSS